MSLGQGDDNPVQRTGELVRSLVELLNLSAGIDADIERFRE